MKISDYTKWLHRYTTYDSWGQTYWKCQCGESRFFKTEAAARKAINAHLQTMGKKNEATISKIDATKYIKRLFVR